MSGMIGQGNKRFRSTKLRTDSTALLVNAGASEPRKQETRKRVRETSKKTARVFAAGAAAAAAVKDGWTIEESPFPQQFVSSHFPEIFVFIAQIMIRLTHKPKKVALHRCCFTRKLLEAYSSRHL